MKTNANVFLIDGTTDNKCQRCKFNTQEVIIRTDKDHGYCAACVANMVETAIGLDKYYSVAQL
jgi:hypothetical protein